MNRPTAMHVISGLSVGGAEVMLERLVATPGRHDHIVVSLTEKGPHGARIEAMGIAVHTLHLGRPAGTLLGVPRLAGLIRKARPAILQGWMNHGNMLATIVHRTSRSRMPLIWNVLQSLGDIGLEKPVTQGIIRLNARLSRAPAAIVYNSRAGADQHESIGYARDKRLIIPNGFDLEEFRPSPERRRAARDALGVADDEILFGLVGRFHPTKNAAGFLDAAARIAAADPKARFLLAGPGYTADNPELMALVPDRALSERLLLLGLRTDMPELVPALDIACNVSHGEGFANTIGEAMACGVPCLVTDAGDSAAIVGDTGFVTPGLDGAAIAATMRRALALSGDERAALGRAARRAAAEYSLPAMVERYDRLYEAAAAGEALPAFG